MLHSDQLVSNEERVLAAVGSGFVLVRRDGLDVHNGRDSQGWAWRVLEQDCFTLGHGNDLHTPWFGDKHRTSYDCVKALASLLSFLEAWVEADEDSENWGLFTGEALRMWAEANSEEITLARMEVASMIGESL